MGMFDYQSIVRWLPITALAVGWLLATAHSRKP
jgi:hypothetical protein